MSNEPPPIADSDAVTCTTPPADLAGTSTAAPGAAEAPAPEHIGRFRVVGEMARGGMGIVYRAHDPQLDREVAVKVLAGRVANRTVFARRFVDEARITGQLQHPSIPPVHETGELPDGRPFLVMKLIKGRTLDELLGDRADPTADRGARVAEFERVCQAVAYAHDRGVIHRDLKPANVMVGTFGEVQVMDWGLAKVLGENAPPEPGPATGPELTEIRAARDSESYTEAGSLIGTLAYMPPEQAAGAVQQIDTRADVFGLGAILCAIITGKPPYIGADRAAVRLKAVQGKVGEAFARLDACGADPELIILAKRCLAVEPADRPRDAGEVARLVASMRSAADERARQAELNKVRAEGELRAADVRTAEQRKRRRVQAALGLAFTALVVLGGAFAWWQDRQAAGREAERTARQSRASAAVTANTREALERAAEAWTLFDFPDRMQTAADAALAAVGRAEQFAADGELTGELAADLQTAKAEVDDVARHTRLMVEVNRNRNEYALVQGNTQLIVQHRAALRQFGFDPLTDPESEVARRVESSRIRDGLLGVLLEMSFHVRHVPKERRGQYERLAVVARAVRLHLGGPYARWQGLLDRNDVAGLVAFSRTPEPLGFGGWVLIRVGTDLRDAREHDAARDLLRAAVARYPHDVWLRYDLVIACTRLNPPALHEALHHAAAAGTLQPSSPSMYRLLGDVYKKVDDLDGAIVCYREAIRLNPEYAGGHTQLCFTLRQKGDLDGAMVAAREFVRIAPENGYAHVQLGWTHRARKEHDRAAVCYAEVVRLLPENAQHWSEYGLFLKDKGDPAGAGAAFREAFRLTRTNPNTTINYNNLGVNLRDAGELDDALVCFQEAIKLDPKFPHPHRNIGTILMRKGDVDGAIDWYRKAIQLDPESALYRNDLGRALLEKGDLDGAVAAWRDAVRLGANNAQARNSLAWLLAAGPVRVRDAKQALEHATRACELTNWKTPQFIDTLAAAYAAAGDFDKAVESQKQALSFPGQDKRLVLEMRERLDLYTRKKPYYAPELAPRELGPPPRVVK